MKGQSGINNIMDESDYNFVTADGNYGYATDYTKEPKPEKKSIFQKFKDNRAAKKTAKANAKVAIKPKTAEEIAADKAAKKERTENIFSGISKGLDIVKQGGEAYSSFKGARKDSTSNDGQYFEGNTGNNNILMIAGVVAVLGIVGILIYKNTGKK